MWRTGLVAPRHVGSSQIRDQTRVPCTGRRILNHCATREVPAVACLCSVGDLTAFLPLVWDDPVHVGEVDDAGEKKKRLFWEVLKMPKGMEFRTQVKEVGFGGSSYKSHRRETRNRGRHIH